jgi:hypothetical protein
MAAIMNILSSNGTGSDDNAEGYASALVKEKTERKVTKVSIPDMF